MNETKIKQRFENAFNAFFAEENLHECNSLNRTSNAGLLREEAARPFQSDAFKNLIKQIVFFFPGTFILYSLSIVLTAVFARGAKGISFSECVSFACLFLAGILMTWLGLGDVRKPSHCVIPVSIICVGIFSGAIIGLMVAVNYLTGFFSENLPLYIFPLALIAPFLAKGLVDRNSD